MNRLSLVVVLLMAGAYCAGCGGGKTSTSKEIPPEAQAGMAERARSAEALAQQGRPATAPQSVPQNR